MDSIVLSAYFIACHSCGKNGWIISPYGTTIPVYSRRHGYRILATLFETQEISVEELKAVTEQINNSSLRQEHVGVGDPTVSVIVLPDEAKDRPICSIH